MFQASCYLQVKSSNFKIYNLQTVDLLLLLLLLLFICLFPNTLTIFL